jgi:hypothetical protein
MKDGDRARKAVETLRRVTALTHSTLLVKHAYFGKECMCNIDLT